VIDDNHNELSRLREDLIKRFTLNELQDLCFLLDIQYDIIPGSSLGEKARELLLYLSKRNRLGELIISGKKLRPDIDWGHYRLAQYADRFQANHRPKILVINDAPDIILTIKVLIRTIGLWDVISAENGQAGLELAIKERPDVVILDVVMDGMTGYDVLRHIVNKRIPTRVIMMSAYETASLRNFIEKGASDLVTTPFESDRLISAIKQCLLETPTIDVVADNPSKYIDILLSRVESLYLDNRYLRTQISDVQETLDKERSPRTVNPDRAFELEMRNKALNEKVKELERAVSRLQRNLDELQRTDDPTSNQSEAPGT
jgi:CheY-like chemotaxis protein